MNIDYLVLPAATTDVDELARVFRDSGLAERRPVDDAARFTAMIRGADLLVGARLAGRLVGVVRALTDHAYVTYVSDIAVVRDHQRSGIGAALLDEVQRVVPGVKLVLLAAPDAAGYYPKVGFTQHPSAWTRAAGREWARD